MKDMHGEMGETAQAVFDRYLDFLERRLTRSSDLITVAEEAFAKRYGDSASLPAEAQNIDMTLQIIEDVRRTVHNMREAQGGLATLTEDALLAGCTLRETQDCMTRSAAIAHGVVEDEIF